MEADSLNREFADRAVQSAGGRVLLRHDDALELVNRAAEAGVPITGVGAFHPGGPSPDAAADFTAEVTEGHGCWSDAEAFIRAHPALVFALTLGPDPLNAA